MRSHSARWSQIFIKIAVSFSFLMLFVRHSPFAATEVDIMSATTQLCTLISLVYALCIQIGEPVPAPPMVAPLSLFYVARASCPQASSRRRTSAQTSWRGP